MLKKPIPSRLPADLVRLDTAARDWVDGQKQYSDLSPSAYVQVVRSHGAEIVQAVIRRELVACVELGEIDESCWKDDLNVACAASTGHLRSHQARVWNLNEGDRHPYSGEAVYLDRDQFKKWQKGRRSQGKVAPSKQQREMSAGELARHLRDIEAELKKNMQRAPSQVAIWRDVVARAGGKSVSERRVRKALRDTALYVEKRGPRSTPRN
jgi:hypothetical protein